ncbi:gp53-like domain-containing protein [Treponema pectinovorum]|uniref:gp53-like domain-containing protein n=1 Tax=Treponema pectinovorum TaxID=164 RepID=UPI0011CA5141|nr:hypothetical protein [Treponema pectinovorum]
MIAQWGSYPSRDDVTIQFDIPFSNTTYTFVAGGRMRIDTQTKEYVRFSPNAKVDGTFGGYWIAIGK